MVAKITQSETNRYLLNVYENGAFLKTIDKRLYKKYLNKIESMIDVERELVLLEQEVAYIYTLKALAKRSYTRKELTEQLEERGVNQENIQRALERCKAYIQEEEQLRALAILLVQKGKGEWFIEKKLLSRGFDPQQIHGVLSELEGEEERMQMLLRKKFPHGNLSDKERAKAYRFLSRRGFSSSKIVKTLRVWEPSEME